MDEQLKVLLKGINTMKNGQEETRQEMQKGLEETRQEMQKGLESVQKCHELKDSLKEKINSVEDRIAGKMKKRDRTSGNATNESKFVPATPVNVPSAVPLTASPVSVKLSTYDGKTNWEVYKTRFSISEANGWTEGVKACQLAASLRREAC
ncbi:hypothetical protein TNCV_2045461 [Trichonephila clavipes]|uniref:Uncharacterized protein n=1 Tax=Trichonephila clavipes TaxID=2585209 RepID=A0A8X6T416_TRICX|nr:hypothetical protein TNCV_2045461 [Trichonephila clavipes]